MITIQDCIDAGHIVSVGNSVRVIGDPIVHKITGVITKPDNGGLYFALDSLNNSIFSAKTLEPVRVTDKHLERAGLRRHHILQYRYVFKEEISGRRISYDLDDGGFAIDGDWGVFGTVFYVHHLQNIIKTLTVKPLK